MQWQPRLYAFLPKAFTTPCRSLVTALSLLRLSPSMLTRIRMNNKQRVLTRQWLWELEVAVKVSSDVTLGKHGHTMGTAKCRILASGAIIDRNEVYKLRPVSGWKIWKVYCYSRKSCVGYRNGRRWNNETKDNPSFYLCHIRICYPTILHPVK